MVIEILKWKFKASIARNTTFEGDQNEIFAQFGSQSDKK